MMDPNDKSQNVGPNDQSANESAPAGPIDGLHENHANTGITVDVGTPNG